MSKTEPSTQHETGRGNACVLGSGPFGTALSNVLAVNCSEVRLWGRDPALVRQVNEQHENPRYLPGIALAENVRATLAMPEALRDADIVVLAVPSHVLRGVIADARPFLREGAPLVSTSKSIETGTLFTMTEMLQDCLPRSLHAQLAVLSGPSFAKELAMRRATAVTIAAFSAAVASQCRRLLRTDWLRLEVSVDVIGVQIVAALKNVIAIAVGISDGLGLGINTRAAIVTMGLEEIGQLSARLGGDPHTVCGLSGLGDLVLTSSGPMSRSWLVGAELAKGARFRDILTAMGKEMIEGATTAASVGALAQRGEVDLPICRQVARIIDGESAAEAMAELQRTLFRA
jgi:glycerol-3-phosphate dehydrogenase (NAD(P)+)